MHLARSVITRLTQREQAPRQELQMRMIGIVSHDPRMDVEPFARRLHLALLRFGSTAYLDHESVRVILGTGGQPDNDEVADVELNHLFDRYETNHDLVLLVTDRRSASRSRRQP
jgi:hypothetical protein